MEYDCIDEYNRYPREGHIKISEYKNIYFTNCFAGMVGLTSVMVGIHS